MVRGAESKGSFTVTDYKNNQIEDVLQQYFSSQ